MAFRISGAAMAADFVLTAGNWGKAQDDGVAAAGPLDLAGVFGSPRHPRSPAVYSNYGEGTTFVAAPGGQPGNGRSHWHDQKVNRSIQLVIVR